jgi:hypothetical protein
MQFKSIEMFYEVDNYINTYKGVISLNVVEFFDALETVRVNLDKKHSIQRGTEVLYPIYIIMYAQDSLVSKTIRRFTHTPYSHASISFDTSMQNIFSFGKLKIKNNDNELEAHNGAIREAFISRAGMREFPSQAFYEIYTVFITQDAIDRMKKRIHQIFDNPEKYKFSIIGLIKYYLGMTSESETKMFCSQFVASLLAVGDIHLERVPSLYSPYQLKDIQNVTFVERGILKDYNRKRLDQRMDGIVQDIKDKFNMDAE